MHAHILLLASLAGMPSPTLATSDLTGHHVPQIATGHLHHRSGSTRYVHALRKYTSSVPSHILLASSKDLLYKDSLLVQKLELIARQSVPTVDVDNTDEEYLCPVSIGTPAQTFLLDFDSGSSDLWMFGPSLPAQQRQGRTVFNCSASVGCSAQKAESWRVDYGDGSGARGNVVADKVVIGNATAINLPVGLATTLSASFTRDTYSSGLLGLASSRLNSITPRPSTSITFLDAYLPTLPTSRRLFTTNLHHAAPGSYTFGALNTSQYSGFITYTQLTNRPAGFWSFSLAGYTVGATRYAGNVDVIADTGTSLVLMPKGVVQNYYKQVKGAVNSQNYGGWVFPCQSSGTMPGFGVTVGGDGGGMKRTFLVEGDLLVYGQVSERMCYGGLQENQGLAFGILGDVFLKSVFAVFDVGNQRMGFALQK